VLFDEGGSDGNGEGKSVGVGEGAQRETPANEKGGIALGRGHKA